ncbi:MAG: hypothetical protein IPN93_13415, partial [Bacteroidetes bacterium]|nr:hypothetical protein [Bacteroidota bacterium]
MLARFNSNLETINAYSYGTVDYDYGCSISIADGNQLIVVDGLNKAFDLHGVTVPIADNRSTLVVMKFNSTLSSSSFKEFSGNADTYLNPTEVVVDNNYNIYMTGQFSGKVYFGDEPKYGTGDFQTFLVKLNSSLETQWDLTSSGSSGGSTGEQLALDENQNLYLIARIEGMVDWLGDSYNFGTDGNI